MGPNETMVRMWTSDPGVIKLAEAVDTLQAQVTACCGGGLQGSASKSGGQKPAATSPATSSPEAATTPKGAG